MFVYDSLLSEVEFDSEAGDSDTPMRDKGAGVESVMDPRVLLFFAHFFVLFLFQWVG